VSTVNVGVIGVGNCASSLVQGVEYYSNTAGAPAGLTNAVCAGYAVSDVRIAFIRLEGEAFGGTPLELSCGCASRIRRAPPATSSMPCAT
jgi:myo-inositol-1-phosphate synthase